MEYSCYALWVGISSSSCIKFVKFYVSTSSGYVYLKWVWRQNGRIGSFLSARSHWSIRDRDIWTVNNDRQRFSIGSHIVYRIVSARFDRRTTTQKHFPPRMISVTTTRVHYYKYKKALNPINHKFYFYKLFYSMTSMEETTPITTTTTATTTTDHSSEGKPISDAWNERYWYQCESFSKLTFDTFVLLLLHFPFLICFLY